MPSLSVVLLAILILFCSMSTTIIVCYDHPQSRVTLEKLEREVLWPVQDQFGRDFPAVRAVRLRDSLGQTSYTLNKKDVFMCMRKDDQETVYDLNTLGHVLLHELAHVMTKSYGHTPEFQTRFNELKRFRDAKLPSYYQDPQLGSGYCGVVL